MRLTHHALFLGLFGSLAALAACSAPPPPAAPPPAAPTGDAAESAPTAAASSSASSAPATPEPSEGGKPSEPERAQAPAKTLPKSKHTINGVSISDVSPADVQAILEKAGWKVDPSGLQPRAKFGKNETFSVVAYKGPKLDKNVKTAFYFGFARETDTSDPKEAASEENFAPKTLKELYVRSNPKLVYLLDEQANVLVTATKLKGVDDAQLQKLFDSVVVKAK